MCKKTDEIRASIGETTIGIWVKYPALKDEQYWAEIEIPQMEVETFQPEENKIAEEIARRINIPNYCETGCMEKTIGGEQEQKRILKIIDEMLLEYTTPISDKDLIKIDLLNDIKQRINS